eukprot:GEMP01114121.1.p1 GENE.GEMP01114121.1~~GEMP01114121.1.p1  ORF type:complete len:136 (+),score=23.82 GEMP01114121.1:49-456(+)
MAAPPALTWETTKTTISKCFSGSWKTLKGGFIASNGLLLTYALYQAHFYVRADPVQPVGERGEYKLLHTGGLPWRTRPLWLSSVGDIDHPRHGDIVSGVPVAGEWLQVVHRDKLFYLPIKDKVGEYLRPIRWEQE